MKVLHVLNELQPSGAEVMLRIAAPYWKEQGVECELLATGQSTGPFAPQLAAAGYPIHHLVRSKRPAHFMAFRRFVRDGGYGVVHQHVEAAGYWYSTAALAAGVGVVRTIHNNFLFDGWLRRVRGFQRRHLAARGVRFAAIAPGVRDNERQRFGLQTQLVLNWIDDRFMSPPTDDQRAEARRRHGYTERDFVLVSVGNCSQVKNHDVILRAMAACRDLPQLRYLHVGVEQDAHPERRLAQELGVADRVTFVGWTPDPLPCLYAADAYIMPSLFEGISLAAVEAFGTGLPGLLAQVPGLIDHDAFFPSLLYFAPDAQGAERVIRQAVAEAGQSRVERRAEYPGICRKLFSVRRGVGDYIAMYRQAHAH